METKRDVYLSLLVNITSQHYAGFSSPYVEDREGGEVLWERNHLQRLAELLDLIQVLLIRFCNVYSDLASHGQLTVHESSPC